MSVTLVEFIAIKKKKQQQKQNNIEAVFALQPSAHSCFMFVIFLVCMYNF